MVDDFAEIIGMAGCYEWREDPFRPGELQSPATSEDAIL